MPYPPSVVWNRFPVNLGTGEVSVIGYISTPVERWYQPIGEKHGLRFRITKNGVGAAHRFDDQNVILVATEGMRELEPDLLMNREVHVTGILESHQVRPTHGTHLHRVLLLKATAVIVDTGTLQPKRSHGL